MLYFQTGSLNGKISYHGYGKLPVILIPPFYKTIHLANYAVFKRLIFPLSSFIVLLQVMQIFSLVLILEFVKSRTMPLKVLNGNIPL